MTQLTEGTDITRQAITKHLQVLADAGLVQAIKLGRKRLWEFEPTRMNEACRALETITQQRNLALMKLKLAVES